MRCRKKIVVMGAAVLAALVLSGMYVGAKETSYAPVVITEEFDSSFWKNSANRIFFVKVPLIIDDLQVRQVFFKRIHLTAVQPKVPHRKRIQLRQVFERRDIFDMCI